jgi:hypothetical protein
MTQRQTVYAEEDEYEAVSYATILPGTASVVAVETAQELYVEAAEEIAETRRRRGRRPRTPVTPDKGEGSPRRRMEQGRSRRRAAVEEVLSFWLGAGPAAWYKQDDAFDAEITAVSAHALGAGRRRRARRAGPPIRRARWR